MILLPACLRLVMLAYLRLEQSCCCLHCFFGPALFTSPCLIWSSSSWLDAFPLDQLDQISLHLALILRLTNPRHLIPDTPANRTLSNTTKLRETRLCIGRLMCLDLVNILWTLFPEFPKAFWISDFQSSPIPPISSIPPTIKFPGNQNNLEWHKIAKSLNKRQCFNYSLVLPNLSTIPRRFWISKYPLTSC